MKIQNSNELATSPLRKAALAIVEKGLEAIDTGTVIKKTVARNGSSITIAGETIDLSATGKLLVIAVGKCAFGAAAALEETLGDTIRTGIALDIREAGTASSLKRIKALAGTHPLPSDANVMATKAIIEFLSGLTEHDVVIFAISGGGSTLLCQPDGFALNDEVALFKALSAAGATIEELNIVRKHLSLARGGYLAKYAYPARVVSLIFSDVPGNKMEFISSGPTMQDSTTVDDARRILEKYKTTINDATVQAVFDDLAGHLLETPKEDQYFTNVKNIIVASNETALAAMAEEAKTQGYTPRVVTNELRGEARDVALAIVNELDASPPKTALLYGGETTVTITHPGKGGRNLELALSALRSIKDGELVLPFDSDGRDNTDFAGGICDTITKVSAEKNMLSLEQYLTENRSYEFFQKINQYLATGDTGSNVSDLIIALKD